MSLERFEAVVAELCGIVGLPDPQAALARGAIEVEGIEVEMRYMDTDPEAMYLSFAFGIVTAGRTIRVFQMMLEANLNLYAQDQAQFGVDPETGGVLLLVRTPLNDEVDGTWLADTITHYVEHAHYWRDNIMLCTDEAFDATCSGEYTWLRA